MTNKKKIVTIGGGTGSFMILSELKKHDIDITAVVTMFDSGGSTGVLRDELGVLPAGDVRQALVALSNTTQELRDLFLYRFDAGGLEGHNFGNLFLGALEKTTGSFESALLQASQILNIKGTIEPATYEDTQLIVERSDGKILHGEGVIDSSVIQPYKKLLLSRTTKANAKAVAAIMEADLVIINPGNFFCSILPNVLIPEISDALKKAFAKKVFIANLMTKAGHTTNFTAEDYVKHLHKYAHGSFVTDVVVNTNYKVDNQETVKRYSQNGEDFVLTGNFDLKEIKIHAGDLLSRELFLQNNADKVKRSFVRHDSKKLLDVILSL